MQSRVRRRAGLVLSVAMVASLVSWVPVPDAAATPRPLLYVLVGAAGRAAVVPIDTETDRAERPISLGRLRLVGAASSPDGTILDVLGEGRGDGAAGDPVSQPMPGTVVSIRTATGTVRSRVAVPADPRSIAFSPNGAVAYVTSGLSADLLGQVAPSLATRVVTKTSLAEGPIHVDVNPDAIAVSPNGARVYLLTVAATDGEPGPIDVLTRTGGSAVTRIPVDASQVVFTPNSRTAYALATIPPTAATEMSTAVVPIDVSAGTPRRPIAIPGTVPDGLAMSADGRTLWVLGTPDSGVDPDPTAPVTLTPVDVATEAVGAPIDVAAVGAGGPAGWVLTLSADGRAAYVLGTGSADTAGTVYPVDLRTAAVAAGIGVGIGADSVTVSPGGAVLYALDAGEPSAPPVPGAVVPVDLRTDRAERPIHLRSYASLLVLPVPAT